MRRRLVAGLPALLLAGGRAAGVLAGPGLLAGVRSARAGPAAADIRFDAGFNVAFDGYYESGGTRMPLASARLRFEPAAQAYRMRLDVESLLADLFYESSGRLDAGGLHPEHYVERRHLPFGRKRRREARYVPATGGDAGLVAPGTLAVPPGTQDRISLIGQLWRLAGRPGGPFEDGRRFDLALASTSKVRPIGLRVEPPAPLRIGDRNHEAWRVRRVDEPGDDDELDIEVWFEAHDRRLPLAIRFMEPDRALHFEVTSPRG